MSLRVKLTFRSPSQKMKASITASKIASAEKVVSEDIVKFHTFTLQNSENKRNLSNLLLESILCDVIADKNHLLSAKVCNPVVELHESDHIGREDPGVKAGYCYKGKLGSFRRLGMGNYQISLAVDPLLDLFPDPACQSRQETLKRVSVASLVVLFYGPLPFHNICIVNEARLKIP